MLNESRSFVSRSYYFIYFNKLLVLESIGEQRKRKHSRSNKWTWVGFDLLQQYVWSPDACLKFASNLHSVKNVWLKKSSCRCLGEKRFTRAQMKGKVKQNLSAVGWLRETMFNNVTEKYWHLSNYNFVCRTQIVTNTFIIGSVVILLFLICSCLL